MDSGNRNCGGKRFMRNIHLAGHQRVSFVPVSDTTQLGREKLTAVVYTCQHLVLYIATQYDPRVENSIQVHIS